MSQETIDPNQAIVAAAAAKINKSYFEFTNYIVEEYLEHGDMDSYWRLRIVHRLDGTVIIKHLPWDVSGHVCYIAVEAIKEAFYRAYNAGKVAAVDILYAKACEAVGIKPDLPLSKGECWDSGHKHEYE